jgi:hypothetical protein
VVVGTSSNGMMSDSCLIKIENSTLVLHKSLDILTKAVNGENGIGGLKSTETR